MADTFDRSLAHWSEDKRRGMEDFYALATADYRHLAEAMDWKTWFEERQREAGERPLRLLDVACGSGKFPSALVEHAALGEADIRPVAYDLLDPSPFSVAEAKAALRPPFEPAGEHVVRLEDFESEPGVYDIVWATHALYAVPEDALDRAMERFVNAVGRVGVIAHSAAAGHYVRFYSDFLADFRGGEGERYRSAEELLGALDRLGARYQTRDIQYRNGAPLEDEARVEGFLQRCVFDDSVSLAALMAGPRTGPWLAGCRTPDGWRFPQRVKLIVIET
jgi:SAM-dependent methyltransferase